MAATTAASTEATLEATTEAAMIAATGMASRRRLNAAALLQWRIATV